MGVIDFDFCSPGPRLWDLAYFATRIAPLTAVTPEHAPVMADAQRRVEIILDAYEDGHGMMWEDVLRVAVVRLHDLADLCRRGAAGGDKPELLEDADGYERDGRYLASLGP